MVLRFYGSYENIIGIDGCTALINLTSGVALRLNPTLVNDRENIYDYLNQAKQKRLMLAVAGAELLTVSLSIYKVAKASH